MENYKEFTKVEVASIVAIYHVLNGERKYLTNIIADIVQDLNLSPEEKKDASRIAVEELTSVVEWSNDKLLGYYETLLHHDTYVLYKINNTRDLYLDGEIFYEVVHDEIMRRMK